MLSYPLLKILAITCLFGVLSGCDEIDPVLVPENNVSFSGSAGVYSLGAADQPQSQTAISNVNISGIVVRTLWENLETSPGIFNWAFIDGEIAKAKTAGKKVSIIVISNPPWMKDIGVPFYQYIDQNTNHSTYLDTLTDYVPWHDTYVQRLKILIDQLAAKYANEPTVSYFNIGAVQLSRNLPEDIIGGKFYLIWNYDPDYLIGKMKEVLDYYMQRFPQTPLWSSMDYVTFETTASGKAKNYVAQTFADYGIATYPDRFGLWREDLSGCNPNVSQIATSSQWYILQQHTCRTGAQMLWNVQDGPVRMNKCNITPNTKDAVLHAAVQNGLLLGMRYLEIYASDVNDSTLNATILNANTSLLPKSQMECVN